jgi:hypothetical protein
MPRQPSTSPFKAMEEEAYQAFLEWPIWLVLREKELAAYRVQTHLDSAQANPRAAADAGADVQPNGVT